MNALNSYQKLAIATVLATLFLIFVGGLVRAAGAGLGCPDWPRCFGLWIPPLSPEALPAGFDSREFNVVHTWLEYLNRLTGVVIGLLITATFLFSFRYWRVDRVVPVSSGIAFLLVLFQGWLGGQVVKSGLSEGLITVHMILAMVIVNLLLFTAFRVAGNRFSVTLEAGTRKLLTGLAVLLLFFTVIQMIWGTQVREMIDMLKNAQDPLPRELWLEQISGWIYPVHRSFSWLLVLSSGLLWWFSRIRQTPPSLRRLSLAILILVLFQVVFGVGLDWLHMPALFQVLHLLFAALLMCAVVLFLLLAGFSESKEHPSIS